MVHETFTPARTLTFAVLALATAIYTPQTRAQQLDAILTAQAAADKDAKASQERIDKMYDETQDMGAKYRRMLTDAESLETYNEHLAQQVKAQTKEIASINDQLTAIETTNREVYPLMQKMVETLEQFVALDVPFLIDERIKRINTLKELMARADVSVSEKYRRVLEAYQIEMEYGRTLEAYEGKIGEGGAAKAVEFVRLGRISLMYQTLDGKETGYWDADKKSWVQDAGYTHAVREALRVAKKQGAPDLLFVPVPAPKEVQS